MPLSESTDDTVLVRPRAAGRNWAKQARQLHFYLGTFFAPAILFFSLTGGIQLFGLHEAHPDRGYSPYTWMEKLGQVHIHQRFATVPKRPAPPEAAPKPASSGAEARADQLGKGPQRGPRQQPIGTRLAKWFFFLMSLGLVFTTSLGIYLAFKLNRNHGLVWALLVGGTLVPVLLLSF